jgi:hypothetical protein
VAKADLADSFGHFLQDASGVVSGFAAKAKQHGIEQVCFGWHNSASTLAGI